MKWLDGLREIVDKCKGRPPHFGIMVRVNELDRLIAIAELLAKIKEDGTGSVDGKRVWPLRAAHWREASKLLSDEWEAK